MIHDHATRELTFGLHMGTHSRAAIHWVDGLMEAARHRGRALDGGQSLIACHSESRKAEDAFHRYYHALSVGRDDLEKQGRVGLQVPM